MGKDAAAGAQAHTESATTEKTQTSSSTPASGQATGAQAAGKTGETTGQAGGAAAATSEAAAGTEKTGTTTEGAQGAAGAEPGGKDDTAGAASKVPEKYELKVPEGGEEYFRAKDLEFIAEVAKANQWTQEEAQAELVAAAERAKAREESLGQEYLEQLKADEDYGGAHLEETQRLSRKAIDRIFPPGHRLRDEFKKFMNRGVVGNHLLTVAALAEVGRLMSEDSPGQTLSAAPGAGDSAADKLYDNPASKALNEATKR